MSLYWQQGGPTAEVNLRAALPQVLERLGARSKVLAVPPDASRFHSRAGELTQYAYHYYQTRFGDAVVDDL